MALGASLRRALTLWRMPSRLALGIAGAVLLLLTIAWVLAWRGAAALPDSLRWFGTPEYASVSVGPLGTVEYADFRLRGADPREPDVFAASRLVLETPGLHWLLWNGLFGGPSSGGLAEFAGPARLARVQQSGGLPPAFPAAARLRLRAEGLMPGPGLAAAGDLRWVGLSSGAPLDGEGCDGIGRFTHAQLAEMGLGEAPTVAEAGFEATARDTARITLSIEHDSASRIELDMTVRADAVRGLLDADWSRTVILDRRWSVRDLGFVSARNRWCAQRMGISRDGYVDRHLGAIKRELAAAGLVPTRDLESAYRRYAARGGEITWHSRPTLTTPVGQLATFAVGERLRILNATLESVRGRAAAFRFDPAPPPVPEVFAPVGVLAGPDGVPGADPGATAAPARPDASAPAAPAVSAPPALAAPPAAPVPTPSAPSAPATAQSPAPQSAAPASANPRPPAAPRPAAVASSTPPAPASTPTPPPASRPPGPVASVAPAPPVGARLRYADLERLEGRRIEVRSVYGSVRVGTLQKYTDAAITLRLEQRERGLTVTMPQQTVESVRLLEQRFAPDNGPLPPG
jgi:hypothetical protein